MHKHHASLFPSVQAGLTVPAERQEHLRVLSVTSQRSLELTRAVPPELQPMASCAPVFFHVVDQLTCATEVAEPRTLFPQFPSLPPCLPEAGSQLKYLLSAALSSTSTSTAPAGLEGKLSPTASIDEITSPLPRSYRWTFATSGCTPAL
ncbi:hypothetical protein PCANC_22330 [Puccinia coronata f. sp. avenae]|uniref:Uncharacterized protein n=1 Tax=Puccinia coronata f. sp. avenae TaxID=200324 RepID=A0A2N5VE33_9BASI|nr:hypothetical protein PCANC_22330 [Puccinia coronata f. sp. avenae]PLW48176.1 hypothetical protein PCASD_03295 [Puccinia coronata f. sp. avenae]